jgi:hypothetical protein
VLQHVGSDADVEANTKLKGLEEKLAAVGQNISLRVKVKENDMEDEEDEEVLDGEEGQMLQQHRLPQGNGELSTAGEIAFTVYECVYLGLLSNPCEWSEQFGFGSDLHTFCYALLHSTEIGSLLILIAAYMWLEVQHKWMRAVQTIAVLTCRDGIRSHVICIKTDDYRVGVTRGGLCVCFEENAWKACCAHTETLDFAF